MPESTPTTADEEAARAIVQSYLDRVRGGYGSVSVVRQVLTESIAATLVRVREEAIAERDRETADEIEFRIGQARPTPTATDEEAAKKIIAKCMFGAGMPDTRENRVWAGGVESDIAVALARVRAEEQEAAREARAAYGALCAAAARKDAIEQAVRTITVHATAEGEKGERGESHAEMVLVEVAETIRALAVPAPPGRRE